MDTTADVPPTEPDAIPQDNTTDVNTPSEAEAPTVEVGTELDDTSQVAPSPQTDTKPDVQSDRDEATQLAGPEPAGPEPAGPEPAREVDLEPDQPTLRPDPTPEPIAAPAAPLPPVRRAVLPAGSSEVTPATAPSKVEPEPQPEPQPEPDAEPNAEPNAEPGPAATPVPDPKRAPTPEPPADLVAQSARPPRPATKRTTRLAWARIRRAAHPKISRAQMLAGALVAALGFAIVAQITQHGDQWLTGLRPNELVQILENLNDRRDRLNAEKADLEAERRQLMSGTAGSQAAIAAAQSRLDALGILAGTLPAEGPGIQVTIRDPSGAVLPPRLLDLVQELRDAGAEAIQLGTARVVANTAFTDVPGGGVAVNGVRQKSPYIILAIGDGQTMATAMQIPGGAIASLPPGVTGSVAEQNVVRITALRPVPSPRYAQPATTATPTR